MSFNFADFIQKPSERLETPILQGFAKGLIGLNPVAKSPVFGRNPLAGSTISGQTPGFLSAIGSPSVNVSLNTNKSTVISIRRNTRYMEQFNREELQQIRMLGNMILQDLINHSQGPYTQKMLNRAGNPYGWVIRKGERMSAGRNVPFRLGGKSIRHSAKVRGSVPAMSVVNRQSGKFAESWRFRLRTDASGYTMEFANVAKTRTGAPYPWFLAHGTKFMQPHGPWTQVPMAYLSRIDQIHAQAVREASGRFRAMTEMQQMLAFFN